MQILTYCEFGSDALMLQQCNNKIVMAARVCENVVIENVC